MKINFKEMTEDRKPNFKGGEGEYIVKMHSDDLNKIMYGKLEPGSSIGYHSHDTNSEILYILEGKATSTYDGVEECLEAGDSQYCPKGHSHNLVNSGNSNLVVFAVVTEQ